MESGNEIGKGITIRFPSLFKYLTNDKLIKINQPVEQQVLEQKDQLLNPCELELHKSSTLFS